MARQSIAELNVKLTASAEAFDKTLGDAEKRLTGFANKVSSPFNAVRGIGGSFIDTLVNPVNSLVTDMTRFAGLIPGLGGMAAVLAHPIESATEAMERLDKLGKDARRLGLDAQFLRGFRIAAEDEAGAINPVMTRLLRFQAQLRSGAQDIEEAGGSPANKVAKELMLDVEAWKSANPQELFRLFGKTVGDAAKTGTEFDTAARIAGRGVGGLMNTLRNSEAVDEWTAKVQKSGVALKANIALAEQWDEIQKNQRLRTEGKQEKMLPLGMGWAEGWEHFKTGSPLEALATWGEQGAMNYLRSVIGVDQTLSPQSANNLIKSVQEGLVRANDLGGDNTKLNELNDQLNNIITNVYDPSKRPMHFGLAQQIAEIGAKAKDMIPKAPVENLENAKQKAEELKLNLQAVADISKHMTGVFETERLGRVGERLSITQAMLSPDERTAKELDRLSTLGLDDETMRRKLKAMRLALAPNESGANEANVALKGSQEWAKGFNRQVERMDEDQLEATKQTRDAIGRIEDMIRKFQPPTPVQAPP